MNSDQVLLLVIVGLSTWLLRTANQHDKKLAAIWQRLNDLPCSRNGCPGEKEKEDT